MRAPLPSLKSHFSRLVIKMWQAVADTSVQRHATRLIMLFNYGTDRPPPTLGSLCELDSKQSEETPIKRYLLGGSLAQEKLHNVI